MKKIAAILMGIVMIDRYQASGQLFQGFLRLLGALTMQVSPTEYKVNMLSFVYTHTHHIYTYKFYPMIVTLLEIPQMIFFP